jgi:membrane-associated phospholipid phosphatase
MLPASRSIGNRLLGAALLMVVLAAVSYAFWDRPIANWAFYLSRSWANAARRLSGLGEGVYWLVVVLVIGVTAIVRKKHSVSLWASKTAIAIAAAGLAANAVKLIAGRARPRALDQGVWGFHFFEVGYRFNSFPSGHAAIAASVAASICLMRPATWPAAAVLWLALAGGRVLTGSHFLSDVLAGGAVGLLVRVLVSRWRWLDCKLRRLARDGEPGRNLSAEA